MNFGQRTQNGIQVAPAAAIRAPFTMILKPSDLIVAQLPNLPVDPRNPNAFITQIGSIPQLQIPNFPVFDLIAQARPQQLGDPGLTAIGQITMGGPDGTGVGFRTSTWADASIYFWHQRKTEDVLGDPDAVNPGGARVPIPPLHPEWAPFLTTANVTPTQCAAITTLLNLKERVEDYLY